MTTMQASEGEVLLSVDQGVAILRLNRPAKRNAINAQMRAALMAALDRVEGDAACRCAVLTAEGPSFCAGADLGAPDSRQGMSIDEWWQRLGQNLGLLTRLRRLEKPVIACVRGHALGLGCELALWCDIVVAGSSARFGEPEIRHGSMVPSMVGLLANPQLAKLLILTGDTVDAHTAQQMGLVARVVPDAAAEAAALAVARRIAKVPPFAVRYNKRMIDAMWEAAFATGMAHARALDVLAHVQMADAVNVRGERLHDIRREQGVKAFLRARDDPFDEP
jgi:enoyl-CoA hydratase/carnithine racemase